MPAPQTLQLTPRRRWRKDRKLWKRWSDLIIGSTANEELKGAAANDIYIGGAGNFDSYTDQSTSSDLYGGFRNDEFGFEKIVDSGGIDTVDPSPYASIDFTFYKDDYDGNGADDLVIVEQINGANDTLIVLNHFGTGRIEYIKFRDKTLNGASLTLEP